MQKYLYFIKIKCINLYTKTSLKLSGVHID